MDYVIFFISWLVGVFVFSFTIIPILIIFAFGIPTSKRLEKLKVLKPNNGIIKRYFVSLSVMGAILLAVLSIASLVFPNSLTGIIFGGVVVLLFGLGKMNINEKNIEDYVEANKEFFLDAPSVVRYVILGWKKKT